VNKRTRAVPIGIQLDLDDSVPPAEKDRARTLVQARRRGCAARRRRDGEDQQALALAVRDIEAAVCPQVDGLAISKADGPGHVRLLDELVSGLEEKAGVTRVIPGSSS